MNPLPNYYLKAKDLDMMENEFVELVKFAAFKLLLATVYPSFCDLGLVYY